MNRIRAIALLAALAAVIPAGARAQTFGQFTGAEPLPVNARMFGAYLVASDNVASLLAHLRLSFYPGVDFGFHGGLARQDYSGGDRTNLRLGTDFKVGVRHATDASPFSFALGGGLSVETGDDYTVLALGPTAVFSRTFQTGTQTQVTPYGSIGLSFSNIDVGQTSDTDFSIPVRIGAETSLAPSARLVTELQLNLSDDFGDDVGFLAGLNLPF